MNINEKTIPLRNLEIDEKEFKGFVKYLNDFYGIKGVYPNKYKKNLDPRDILKAIDAVASKRPKHEWEWDSLDRELVRDELIKMKKFDYPTQEAAIKEISEVGKIYEEVEISKDDMEKLHKDGEVEIDGEKVSFEEGVIQDREKQLKDLKQGGVVNGGGYGPFEKTGRDTFVSPKGKKYNASSLIKLIGTFGDFKVNESVNEIELKKGDKVRFKNGQSIYILGPKGDGYDYQDGGERGHHPKGWFDMMIKSKKATVESVTEATSSYSQDIAYMTGTRQNAVINFIKKHNIDSKKLALHLNKEKLSGRLDFANALSGKAGNQYERKFVRMFGESVTEADIPGKIPSQVKVKLEKAVDQIKDSNLTYPQRLKVLSHVLDSLNIDKKELTKMTTRLKGTLEGVNESAKPSQVRSVISRVKKDLMKKWKQKGGYENFGDKEGRVLRDKFNFNPYGSPEEREIAKMIQGFEDWAMNYDGNMREGKKVFKVNPQIGKVKYSISSHDGVKKHKDGSDFFDIETFKNKVDLEKAIKDYTSKGFKMESVVNEADVVGKTIFSDGKGKLYFGYYKTDDGVTFVDYKTWKNLGFKDVSKGDTNKDRVIKAIVKNQKQFNKKVDFNMWAKQKKRTFEETMDWFIQNGWINNINKGGIKE